ncbi:hypothetical protein BKA61DRAFT_597694 [Leptodontidium sp. MPI-SDFR-AT-0119]|nr:hypothetical protein BKA61DRAFT_597694 [Leptodontidium sp. MPI-SDFR-AT-0119]
MEVSFDIVTRNWSTADRTYPAVPGQNNFVGHIKTMPDPLNRGIASFPIRMYPRSTGGKYAFPSTQFSDSTEIKNGEYRVLGRALRITGDPKT